MFYCHLSGFAAHPLNIDLALGIKTSVLLGGSSGKSSVISLQLTPLGLMVEIVKIWGHDPLTYPVPTPIYFGPL